MTKALDTPLVRIVDDDAEQLKSLAFLLRMGGWEVMTYQPASRQKITQSPETK